MVMEEDLVISIAVNAMSENYDEDEWRATPCQKCIGRGMRAPNLRDLRLPRVMLDQPPPIYEDVEMDERSAAPLYRPGRGRGRGRGRARQRDEENLETTSISSHGNIRPDNTRKPPTPEPEPEILGKFADADEISHNSTNSERFSEWDKYPEMSTKKESLFMPQIDVGVPLDYDSPSYGGQSGFYSGNAFGSSYATNPTGGTFMGFGKKLPEPKKLEIRDLDEFPDLSSSSEVTDTPPRNNPSWGSPKASKTDPREFPPLGSTEGKNQGANKKTFKLANIWNNEAEIKFIGNKVSENTKKESSSSRSSPDDTKFNLVKLGKKSKKSKKLPEAAAVIKIENLPIDIENNDIVHLIENYGQVVDIETDRDGELAVSTVWLSEEEACDWCISCLHDIDSLFPEYNHTVPLNCYRVEENK